MKVTLLSLIFGFVLLNGCLAQFDKDKKYQIINKKSGKAMCIYGDSTDVGDRVYQWEASERKSTIWRIEYTNTSDYYFIKNEFSGLYLSVYKGSKKNYAVCVVDDFKSKNFSYLWKIKEYHSDYYKLRNGNSHKPIGAYHDRVDNGTYIVQEDDRGHDGLFWIIKEIE